MAIVAGSSSHGPGGDTPPQEGARGDAAALPERIQLPEGGRPDVEAIFLLVTEREGVYFVNNGAETLTRVTGGAGGMATVDAGPLSVRETDRGYRDVGPGEGVLIGHHDGLYDLDFLWSYGVEVQSPTAGTMHFHALLRKGEVPGAVLMWRDLPPLLQGANGEPVDPVRAAGDYKATTGRFLPRDVPLNRGDLMMPHADSRVARAGVRLERQVCRGGRVTVYDFRDDQGRLLFRAHDVAGAARFVEALRGP